MNTISTSNSQVFLKDAVSFPAWFLQLKLNATFRNIWHIIDPAAPDAPHVTSQEPSPPPTIDSLIAELNAYRQEALLQWEADGRTRAEKGPKPTETVAVFEDVKEEHAARQKEYVVLQSTWSQRTTRYQQIWDWIRTTVDEAILAPHLEKLVRSDTLSLQAIVRSLQAEIAPSDDQTAERVRQEYRRVLVHARQGNYNPARWHSEWYRVYQRALSSGITDVQGSLAVKDFLDAVAVKFAPDWGRQQLNEFIAARELGEPLRTLDQYGKVFSSYVEHTSFRSRNEQAGIFATLGERSDTEKGHVCPCRKSPRRHPWHPEHCALLELALTGKTSREITATDEELGAIRERAKGDEKLIKELEKKGWKTEQSSGVRYPGSVKA